MAEEPIRVAQILARAMNGGAENLILNYYLNIDRTKVQFDFYIEHESKMINREAIEKLGGRLFIIPSVKNQIAYQKFLTTAFKREKYDIVQANINTLSGFPLRAAKKCGVKYRIVNSLSTSNKSEHLRNLIKNILKPYSKKFANIFFACSDLAGEWQYGKKLCSQPNYHKVYNAVNIDKYQYSQSVREELKKKHGLEGKFVVGTIGRLENQKNQKFLLKIFRRIADIRNDAFLIIIGDGKLEEELRSEAERLGISDKMLILTSKEVGVRGAASKYYSLFDTFVLPSLYEGLPTVGIEAQLAGLPCFFASTITSETKICENSYFIDLDKTDEEWAKIILDKSKNIDRTKKIVCEDYDIKIQGAKLNDFYLQLGGKK